LSKAKLRSQFPELVPLNGVSRGEPVFWMHGGLGGVEVYHPFACSIARPFYGIQARGWLTSRAPLQGIPAMAAYYVHIIQSVRPEGPYDLGGYSLGGALAYEVARQLQELGHAVRSIVMLDSLDSVELKKVKPSQTGLVSAKSAILQAVNMALLTTIMHEPGRIDAMLIRRDQVDATLDEDAMLKQLVTLAKGRGLNRSEAQLEAMIRQFAKVQTAYNVRSFSVLPLPRPSEVTAYYFRNKSGRFLGELEPYFVTLEDQVSFDHKPYWREWQERLPNLHMMDVESSNHMMFISEPKVFSTICELCRLLYSEGGMTPEALALFKASTRRTHGTMRADHEAGQALEA
jgi:thioesterase domain-containing protein